ncbi:MAG: 2-oxoglutarate dehydrogenase E1 component, partial [Calditrichaeota bacterium]|nr:2-oxoglutarate dehydrogenase E1 component [Calditrichota bacterium]
SSARLERYLQMCGQYNMVVCNVTSPANFFHLLRRQVKSEFRKPLIVMSPKSLLRHPEVISDVKELETGSFQEIIYDTDVKPAAAKKVIVCSGKVYFDLKDKQRNDKIKDVAILRFEQLYPIIPETIKKLKQKYKAAKRWVWVQEESLNMGAWDYIHNRIPIDFECVSRPVSASPATGSSHTHDEQQAEIIKSAFE